MQSHNIQVGKIYKCQICHSSDLYDILDLGKHAPCDSLVKPDDLSKVENKFPLKFQFCKNCFNVQIDYVVDPKLLFFEDYPYRSGITKTLVDKLDKTSQSVVDKFKFEKNSLCVDVGSNDGTLLQGFKKRGFKVLGIEATNIAELAIENGIETIKCFFDKKVAMSIKDKFGPAKVITATNVFAHIPNLQSFIEGINILLDDNGVFVNESHYLVDILQKNQFDSIYHEHLRYYSVHSLEKLFSYYDLHISDVERIKNYGGSIRVFTQKTNTNSKKLEKMKSLEIREKVHLISTYEKFASKILHLKKELKKILSEKKKKGYDIYAIGCPGRASTLVNFFEIDNKSITAICEQSNSLKLGMFLPGEKIPIVDEKILFDIQPEYCLMLSWHYSKEIIAILRKKGLKSKIIIPLPEISIIE